MTYARIFSVTLCLLLFAVEISNGQDVGTVVASELNGPMGVLLDDRGDLWVVDSGVGGDEEMPFPDMWTFELKTVKFGHTSRVLRYGADGSVSEEAVLPSFVTGRDEIVGGARLAIVDDEVYVTSGAWMEGAGDEPRPGMASVVRIENGNAVDVVNFFPVERDKNPDGYLVDANPYGMAAGPDGNLWVTDSAGNTLLRVDRKTGALKVVAVFDGVPGPLPNPNRANKMEADPVPTGLAFDAEGNLYVALLPGFPFLPGSAKVVAVDDDGVASDYATGLTMLVDLRFGPDGEMYAVSLGQFTEQGPQPNTGAIVRVRAGDASEEVLSGLSFPTSIDFNGAGDAFVTINGVGAPGTGQVVKYAGLASSD